jgi:glycosyltransferase involved in cell wall biosynthesis
MISRVVVASPGGWNHVSAQYRLGPLARNGAWPLEVLSAATFPGREQIQGLLERGGDDAALILQRAMPCRDDVERLRHAYRGVVFDFDDAIYAVPPDLKRSRVAKLPKQVLRLIVRGSPTASARRRPLARVLAQVDACVVGNAILARFASRYAKRVTEIPTTVEPVLAPPATRPDPPVVVWMGLPDNMQPLELVRRPLERLTREQDFRLRIVSSETWQDAPLPVEFVRWSPDAAREALLSSSVGLAPLTDDAWTRGKCAFRAIQYGGHALPALASPVGITDRVVLHGKTGFLVRGPEEWAEALRQLLANRELVARMGAAALDHVQTSYSDSLAVRRWQELLTTL